MKCHVEISTLFPIIRILSVQNCTGLLSVELSGNDGPEKCRQKRKTTNLSSTYHKHQLSNDIFLLQKWNFVIYIAAANRSKKKAK